MILDALTLSGMILVALLIAALLVGRSVDKQNLLVGRSVHKQEK